MNIGYIDYWNIIIYAFFGLAAYIVALEAKKNNVKFLHPWQFGLAVSFTSCFEYGLYGGLSAGLFVGFAYLWDKLVAYAVVKKNG